MRLVLWFFLLQCPFVVRAEPMELPRLTKVDTKASANTEMLFVSRQIYEILRSMPRTEDPAPMRDIRSGMMEILQQPAGPRDTREFRAQFSQTASNRAMGQIGNSALPTGKLMWGVLSGQATERDFQDVAKALEEDPTKGSQYAIEVLPQLRKYLAKKHEEGRFGASGGLMHWLTNTKVTYHLNASPTMTDGSMGFAVSPKHTVGLQYEVGQRRDSRAQQRWGLQYDLCRDEMGRVWGTTTSQSCEHQWSTGLNFGRDLPGTRNQFGQYWNWGVSVTNHRNHPGQRDSQEGRIRLTIPLP